jgi:hypothetical protein
MAIITNCEMHHLYLDPKRPSKKFNPENPTWEVQIRTADPVQAEEWRKLNLRVKLMIYKEGDPKEGEPILNAEGKKQWRVNLKKRSMKANSKEPNQPVSVVNGKGADLDPNTIGSGSLGSIRLYQAPYKDKEGKDQIRSTLMAVQVVRHIVYTPKPIEEFAETETETVTPAAPADAANGGTPAAPEGRVF